MRTVVIGSFWFVTGVYPSPKYCDTMIAWKDNLVLFGGWSHASAFPLHQVGINKTASRLLLISPFPYPSQHVPTPMPHKSDAI